MKIEIKQQELDFLNDRIKELNDKKKVLTKEISGKGYSILNGKIVKEKEVYGAFYDLNFFSHFDEHASDRVDYSFSGANVISDYSFKRLKDMIKEIQMDDNLKDILTKELFDGNIDLIDCDWFYDSENFWDFFTIDGDKIRWEYNGDGEQGELYDGSFVEFRKELPSVIKKVKTIYC